jgi:hypothetical protein
MNYRMATDKGLMQLADLRWDFRMEGGDELPAVTEFNKTLDVAPKRGLIIIL